MRRKRKIVLVTVSLLLLSIFMSACTWSFSFNGCVSKNKGGYVSDLQPDNSPLSRFVLKVEKSTKASSFYCVTFDGEVNFDYYPNKIIVRVAGQESELLPTTVSVEDGYYSFGFNDQEIAFSLTKGKHEVRIFGVENGIRKLKQEKATLIADDDYFICNVVCEEWFDNGSIGKKNGYVVMDKNVHWTPFYT